MTPTKKTAAPRPKSKDETDGPTAYEKTTGTEPVNPGDPGGTKPVDTKTEGETPTESGAPVEVIVTGTPVTEQPEDVKLDTEEVDVDFFYPTKLDPARQISPTGIYLDDEMRRQAEIQRAKIEDREPDLENPPAYQGSPLLPREHFNHSLNTLQVPVDKDEAHVTLPVVQVVNQ